MAKKTFKTGIDSLIQNTTNNIPSEEKAELDKSKHLKVKGTYYFESELLEDAKSVAYHSRIPIGDVLNQALKMYLNKYMDLEKARKIYSQKT